MSIDASALSAKEAYRLLTTFVVPRPIAWVSSVGSKGTRNLAPFSYFQAVCSRPPTVMLSIAWRADGTPKDTLRNILEVRDFTINLVDEDLAEAMNRTSADYPPSVSEWDDAGVTAADGVFVNVPRVAEASAVLECRMTHAVPVGTGRMGRPSVTVVFARVLGVAAAPEVVAYDETGRPVGLLADRVGPVGRMGGAQYVKTGDRFEMARPPVPEADGG